MDVIEVFLDLNLKIQKEFTPLNWIDVTAWVDECKGSICFTDDGETADEFFSKMRDVKDFIKGFDTAEIMTVDYCDKIIDFCKQYGIECDDSMPYGILDAEYELEEFFKDKLQGGE